MKVLFCLGCNKPYDEVHPLSRIFKELGLLPSDGLRHDGYLNLHSLDWAEEREVDEK